MVELFQKFLEYSSKQKLKIPEHKISSTFSPITITINYLAINVYAVYMIGYKFSINKSEYIFANYLIYPFYISALIEGLLWTIISQNRFSFEALLTPQHHNRNYVRNDEAYNKIVMNNRIS